MALRPSGFQHTIRVKRVQEIINKEFQIRMDRSLSNKNKEMIFTKEQTGSIYLAILLGLQLVLL
jgi:hypothetical protein